MRQGYLAAIEFKARLFLISVLQRFQNEFVTFFVAFGRFLRFDDGFLSSPRCNGLLRNGYWRFRLLFKGAFFCRAVRLKSQKPWLAQMVVGSPLCITNSRDQLWLHPMGNFPGLRLPPERALR